MTRVKLSISGKGDGTDAPLVDDMLEHIRDYFAMLDGVAASIAGDEKRRFEWRIVDASKNSPLAFTAEAFPRSGFRGVEAIAEQAKFEVAAGIQQLASAPVRPKHFSDNVLEAAERFIRRNTRSLSTTKLEQVEGQPELVLTPSIAIDVIGNLARVKEEPAVKAYEELGTIEGFIQNVGTDQWGRPLLLLKDRVHNREVRCLVEGQAHTMLEQEPVANVAWRKRRVEVSGRIAYRSLGRVQQATIEQIRFLDHGPEPAQFVDVIDRDFTGGLSSVEYLRKVRDGDA